MFPFHRDPPSKIEVVKKGVAEAAQALLDAVPAEKIEDKLDDLKKTAAQVAIHAAQVAHHAGEIAAHKIEGLHHSASVLSETASGAAHHAGESAAQRAQAARESATHAKEALQERAAHVKDSAIAFKENLRHRASHTADDAQESASEAKKTARDAAKAAHAEISDQKAEMEAKAYAKGRAKAREIEETDVEIEVSDTSSKLMWIVLGLAIGAILVLLTAPTTGRRRRAAIKDRLGKVSEGITDAATAASDKAIDIAHRVEGLAHTVETKIAVDAAEGDDDATIADRVRSVLGHHEVTRGMERLNIDCVDGIVTLRGPMIDSQTQETIIAAVKAVPGVKQAVSDFMTDEEPADPATYAN